MRARASPRHNIENFFRLSLLHSPIRAFSPFKRGAAGGWRAILVLLAGPGAVFAQTVVLDSFNAGASTGSVRAGTSWVGNVTPNPTTITVGGNARDENGWIATGQSINATGMNFLSITAQRDGGNAASSVVVQFEDRNLRTQIFSVSSASFALGTLTQVQIPITGWSAGFDQTQITSWSIGGGGLGTTAFHMTFDQLALSATASSAAPVVPTITADYGGRTAVLGATVSFAITVTGSAPFTYQWSKNGAAVTGNTSATTATLTLANINATDAGSYTCVVTNGAGSVTSGTFTLTVNATPAAITLGNLAQTFDGATHSVTAVTTPAGLRVVVSYNNSAALPTNAGSYAVLATINEPNYSGRAEAALVIARAPQSITFAPLPTTVTVGTPVTFAASASSGGAIVFSLVRGNARLDGAALTPLDSGLITIRATQAGDSNYLPGSVDFAFTAAKQNQAITFAAISGPTDGSAPLALSASSTSRLPVTFNVVTGPATLAGSALTVTGSGLVIVRASQLGNDAFNPAPDVDRNFTATMPPPATPVITPPPPPPSGGATQPAETRLANFSTRARAGVGDQVAIAGFVITGDTDKRVLVRAIGPTLAGFGVTGTINAPALELYSGSRLLARNTGWATNADPAAIAAAAQQAGAFALTAGTADSALVTALPPGNYTAVISAADARAGVGLVEVYDLSNPARGQRVSNLSIRATAGADAETLIVGVVVDGSAPKRILIRAAGPALVQFGVGGVLARPQLAVFTGTTEIARNVGWSSTNATAIADAAASVGAFPFGAASADSALIVPLAPGAYTAQVSGVGGASGVALVEVYELP